MDIAICAKCAWIGSGEELRREAANDIPLPEFLQKMAETNLLEMKRCPNCGSAEVLYKRTADFVVPGVQTNQPVMIPSVFGTGPCDPGPTGERGPSGATQAILDGEDIDDAVLNDILDTASNEEELESIKQVLGVVEEDPDAELLAGMGPEERARFENDRKAKIREQRQKARRAELEKIEKQRAKERADAAKQPETRVSPEARPKPRYPKYQCQECGKTFESKIKIPDAKNNGASCPDCIKRKI